MRYSEITESSKSLEQQLAELTRRRDELVDHWNTNIESTEPQGERREPPGGGEPYYVHTPETMKWYNDPEKGRFWELHIYPLNQAIKKLQAEVKRQRRTAALKDKRGDVQGFNTNEVLYHGTDAEFEQFDRKKARTAAHIYTSPDIDTAKGYGKNIYAVYGRQEPQAVLTAEDCDYQLLRKVYRRGGYKSDYDLTYDDLAELVTNGELYNFDHSGYLQDSLIDECVSLGYRSVRITDAKPGGGSYSDSVIFHDPDDLQIIEKVE